MDVIELENVTRQLDGIACALDIMAQAAESEGIDYVNLGAFCVLLSKDVAEARDIASAVLRSALEREHEAKATAGAGTFISSNC